MKKIYYSGGFAEIVPNPSKITFTYLKEWFNGQSSLGKAMEILGLPYQKNNLPILELIDGELMVNLQNEEQTLYANTIFKYADQNNINGIPKLVISIPKLLNPLGWIHAISILTKQSTWIANPQKTVDFANKLVKDIPKVSEKDHANIEQILKNDIWPPLIAVGVLSEFFNQVIKHDSGKDFLAVHAYVSRKQAVDDWFYLSVSKQQEVKDKKLSFKDYINKYGIRADKDYDIGCPRWYEIKDVIKRRIDTLNSSQNIAIADESHYKNLNKRLQNYIDTLVKLQVLRSEAKRKALLGIDLLRKKLKPQLGKVGQSSQLNQTKSESNLNTSADSLGQGVSAGVITGIVTRINTNDQLIPKNCIGIFPNASPQFSMQFPKCNGIIFLKGGQTSHGSIVAREFGIPAIINSKAESLENGIQVAINGSDGSWVVGENKISFEGNKLSNKSKKQTTVTDYLNPILGGKASALQKLSNEDLPVPEFFVLNTELFQIYLGKKLPEEFKKWLFNKFNNLHADKVAVRSSAAGEDSVDAAWAGQLETYLNVTKDNLIDNIQKCWKSINNERVKEYIKIKHLKNNKLLLAVIIQRMINSDISGVIFTANSVTKKDDEIVIEAGLGLGENIVQGNITPNRFLLDKNSLDIKQGFITGKQVLDEKYIIELGKIALKIEKIFQCPQDIEWAIENNKIYILQSRPITTL